VFFTVVASPALHSDELRGLLTETHFPFFSGAIGQLLLARYFYFQIACGLVAWLLALAEWVYLGKPERKFVFSLLGILLVLALIGGHALWPKLHHLHLARFASNLPPAARAAAAKSFGAWNLVCQTLNLAMLGGLAVYLWRVTHPADAPRFVSAVKFRG